jgi:hypothetical protein
MRRYVEFIGGPHYLGDERYDVSPVNIRPGGGVADLPIWYVGMHYYNDLWNGLNSAKGIFAILTREGTGQGWPSPAEVAFPDLDMIQQIWLTDYFWLNRILIGTNVRPRPSPTAKNQFELP